MLAAIQPSFIHCCTGGGGVTGRKPVVLPPVFYSRLKEKITRYRANFNYR